MKKSKSKSVTVRKVSAPKRRTHRRKSRRGLSAIGGTSMMNGLKSAGGAAIGGYIASMLNGMLPEKIGTLGRIGIGVALGVAANAFANSPNVGAGAVGAMIALNNPTKGLNEFADDDSLSEEPLYLSEAGEPLVLAEDGNFYYQ